MTIRGPLAKGGALTVALGAGSLLLTQVVFAIGDRDGTPASILFSGVLSGLLSGLTAAGLVLVYRTTKVINFAQVAIGIAGGVLVSELIRFTEIPFLLACLFGLMVAAATGLFFDLVFV